MDSDHLKAAVESTRKKVVLHFFNQREDELPVVMDVEDSPIAEKWFRHLHQLLQKQTPLVEDFLFFGFPQGPRGMDELCREMNRHIKLINSFPWKDGYHIQLEFSPGKLQDKAALDEMTNQIHHHFEILIGQVWRVSPYYEECDEATRFSIRKLNQLCHLMENAWQAKQLADGKLYSADPVMVASFMIDGKADREELATEDYEHFTLDWEFGDVVLAYSQLGKSHWEAFLDDDPHIQRENISGIRYVTGEFVIHWGMDFKRDTNFWQRRKLKKYRKELKEKFRQWLIEHKYDPEDKLLGLGLCRVAKIDRSQFGSMDLESIHQLLVQHPQLKTVGLQSGTRQDLFPIARSEG